MSEEIDNIEKALSLLKTSTIFYKLLPEVRSNLVMCKKDAKSINDVVGIPGRITHVFGKITPVGKPSFGGSWHMARFLLSIRRYYPFIRAAINIRYIPELIGIAKELGYHISFFDRRKEPVEIKKIEGRTMEWAANEIYKNAEGRVPQVVYDLGDWGKEPGIMILGKDAIEVVKIALKLAEEANKRGII